MPILFFVKKCTSLRRMEKKQKKLSRSEAKNLKVIGERIRELRMKKKMTQAELAVECELDKQTVFRLEKGEINMTLSTLFRVADALGIVATHLLSGLKD